MLKTISLRKLIEIEPKILSLLANDKSCKNIMRKIDKIEILINLPNQNEKISFANIAYLINE